MYINKFVQTLKEKNIQLDDRQLEQFALYADLIKEWNEKINLTSIVETEEIYQKHFIDSLTLAFDLKLKDQKLCDVGSGAGFPSIPLKIAFPSLDITIVDPLQKRMAFLEMVVKELKLENVHFLVKRAEELGQEKRAYFDIVTARAVARLNILAELCLPLVKKDGYFVALKGKQGIEEKEEAAKGIEILGGKLEKEVDMKLYDDESTRINLFFKKVKDTPNKYPRQFAKIKKNPL